MSRYPKIGPVFPAFAADMITKRGLVEVLVPTFRPESIRTIVLELQVRLLEAAEDANL